MASYSGNFSPKKKRTEGGVAVLYWCIVACWFCDSRTVGIHMELNESSSDVSISNCHSIENEQSNFTLGLAHN